MMGCYLINHSNAVSLLTVEPHHIPGASFNQGDGESDTSLVQFLTGEVKPRKSMCIT